ncbi:MAG: zinc ribbon domain-containing protein [Oscillospiraceae bacterium]
MTGLIVLGVIIAGGFLGCLKIRSKLSSFSRQAFGTSSLSDGYKKLKRELSVTPKSINAMTRVCLPRIQRDFPKFNYEQFKIMAENMLRSAFSAISSDNSGLLKNASAQLTEKVSFIISENKRLERSEAFDDIKIYKTEIADYKKQSGTCVITLQSAVSYKHYIASKDTLIEGDRELTEQTRYNTELVYVQDLKQVGSSYNNAVGTSCPNCGAPITSLGNKTCEYCGMAVQEINVYVWSISDFIKI